MRRKTGGASACAARSAAPGSASLSSPATNDREWRVPVGGFSRVESELSVEPRRSIGGAVGRDDGDDDDEALNPWSKNVWEER